MEHNKVGIEKRALVSFDCLNFMSTRLRQPATVDLTALFDVTNNGLDVYN
jgi:hypothetical protein